MLSVNSQIILQSLFKAQRLGALSNSYHFKDSNNNVYFASNGGLEVVCYIKDEFEKDLNQLLEKEYIKADFFIRNGGKNFFSLYAKPLRQYERGFRK